MSALPYGIPFTLPSSNEAAYLITPEVTCVSARGPRQRRVALMFPYKDAIKLGRLMNGTVDKALVYDAIDHRLWRMTRADCGLGCRCAMGAEAIDA